MDEHRELQQKNRKCKKLSKKSYRAEEYSLWLKNTIDGFNIRLDEAGEKQWSGRQGSGTHPNRAAKRKKKSEKMKIV